MARHTVLIPLDGSQFSREIVPHVLRLFSPQACTLKLLRVAQLPHGLVGAPPRPIASHWLLSGYTRAEDVARARHPIYATQEEASTEAALAISEHELAEELREAGYEVSMVVRFGDPVEEIIAFAEQARVDIIGMATHGWSGFRNLVLGSVAEQVLQRSHIPVLFIRPFAHDI